MINNKVVSKKCFKLKVFKVSSTTYQSSVLPIIIGEPIQELPILTNKHICSNASYFH